ncbi:MAG: inositol monophosphatase family protein [Microbacterium sp.]
MISSAPDVPLLPGGAELGELLVFAEGLARRAGRLVRDASLDREDAETKANVADWVTPVDGRSEDLVRAGIAERYPAHAIIGEERAPEGDTEHARIVWHIDPIDGTTNYVYGIGNVSVSLAALDARGEAVVGVVHDVYRDQTIGAARGHGVRIDGRRASAPVEPVSVAGAVVLTEWSGGFELWEGMEEFLRWAASQKATVRIIGSCALALAHAGLGRAAATILPGRHSSWDLAAGVAIATEGGLRLCDVAGETTGVPAQGLLVAPPALVGGIRAAWAGAAGS